MLESVALWFIGVGLIAFLIAGAWAPFETLAWWAGQHARTQTRPAPPRPTSGPAIRHFAVYLGGIDSIDGDEHTQYELPFLNGLAQRFDEHALKTVFPYAASGEPLLRGPRLFRAIWQALHALPGEQRSWLSYLINARNAFQVLVAADRRYGPIFGQALASLIESTIGETTSGARLTLIGYSGGAQMALSAAPYLAAPFRGGVGVISIGGTIISTQSLDFIDRLDHLTGTADLATRAAAVMCGARWPFTLSSSWRRANTDGRLVLRDLGAIGHTGPRGYFGAAAGDGGAASNLEVTLASTLACLERPLHARALKSRRTLQSGGVRLTQH